MPDELDCRRVFQRGKIAGILVEICRSNDAPHHLVVSCAWQGRHEVNRLGPQWFTQRVGDKSAKFVGKLRRLLYLRARDCKGQHAFAFHIVGNADDRGLGHCVMRHENGLHLGGTDTLTGNFQGVVAAAEDVPMAVAVSPRPVAVRPDVRGHRDQYVSI